jgi:hypothetical protein
MGKPAIEVDDTMWPLVVIRYNGPRTEADWHAMFAAYDRMHTRRERFATINDTTSSPLPSAVERSMIGEHAKRHEDATRRYLVATCMVIENAIMRGALTAIHWVYRPAYKLFICATLHEAYVVAARELREEGIALHPQHARLIG